MPRYYAGSSLLGLFLRLFFALSLLVLFAVGVEWLFTVVLPKAAPWLVLAVTFVAGLVVSRLRG